MIHFFKCFIQKKRNWTDILSRIWLVEPLITQVKPLENLAKLFLNVIYITYRVNFIWPIKIFWQRVSIYYEILSSHWMYINNIYQYKVMLWTKNVGNLVLISIQLLCETKIIDCLRYFVIYISTNLSVLTKILNKVQLGTFVDTLLAP